MGFSSGPVVGNTTACFVLLLFPGLEEIKDQSREDLNLHSHRGVQSENLFCSRH